MGERGRRITKISVIPKAKVSEGGRERRREICLSKFVAKNEMSECGRECGKFLIESDAKDEVCEGWRERIDWMIFKRLYNNKMGECRGDVIWNMCTLHDEIEERGKEWGNKVRSKFFSKDKVCKRRRKGKRMVEFIPTS
jgi:hypothetical protein